MHDLPIQHTFKEKIQPNGLSSMEQDRESTKYSHQVQLFPNQRKPANGLRYYVQPSSISLTIILLEGFDGALYLTFAFSLKKNYRLNTISPSVDDSVSICACAVKLLFFVPC